MTRATIEAMRRMSGLASPRRDSAHLACLRILVTSVQHLERAGHFTSAAGFVGLDRRGHGQIVRRLVDCATRPYDPAHPECHSQHPAASAFETLYLLCTSSTFIAQIARDQRAYEPLAVALASHLRRGEDAEPDCRPLMRLSVLRGFVLVHQVLLNTAEMQVALADNWSSTANPFVLVATWCGVLFQDDNRCICVKELLIHWLGSARKVLTAADSGDGLPSSHTSALAIAIPQAVRVLTARDKTAARDVRRRQLLHGWLSLAPVAGITSKPLEHFCCGCGAPGGRFRCAKCGSAICAWDAMPRPF